MKHKNQYWITALLLCSAAHATYWDLPCTPGYEPCPGAKCTTVVFKNKTANKTSVSGKLSAKLSGAAKWTGYDGKFEFQKTLPENSEISCHIDTSSLAKYVRYLDVVVTPDGINPCSQFVPKGEVAGKNIYTAHIEEGHCRITR